MRENDTQARVCKTRPCGEVSNLQFMGHPLSQVSYCVTLNVESVSEAKVSQLLNKHISAQKKTWM